MRPKIICIDEKGDRWLAKFARKDDVYDNPLVEYATMSLAFKFKITIPDIMTIKLENSTAFLIIMFDNSSNIVLSALSVLNTNDKDFQSWNYIKIFQKIISISENKKIKKDNLGEEFFRRIAFNIFCNNTDDHPRNHSILWNGKDLLLSPCYDITPSYKREGATYSNMLACAFGDENRLATYTNLLSSLDNFYVSQAKAYTILLELKDIANVWQEHFKKCGVSDEDINYFTGAFTDTKQLDNAIYELSLKP